MQHMFPNYKKPFFLISQPQDQRISFVPPTSYRGDTNSYTAQFFGCWENGESLVVKNDDIQFPVAGH
jgi:hypothetical protein